MADLAKIVSEMYTKIISVGTFLVITSHFAKESYPYFYQMNDLVCCENIYNDSIKFISKTLIFSLPASYALYKYLLPRIFTYLSDHGKTLDTNS